jgi:uncharacterized protein
MVAPDCSARTGATLRAALLRPETYPHHPATVELCETHISWVFLAGEWAYKLKKPLVLDFVDYGTSEQRRRMCEEEVRLNRRLAPDLYLGVRGLSLTAGRVELTDPDDPGVLDFVVEMRRYDEAATLAARLARGELERDQVKAVADKLVAFHAAARPIRTRESPVRALQRRFERNLHELLSCAPPRDEVERVQGLRWFAHAFIAGRAHTLEARARGGFVREGHGDLRAEHVLVGDDVRIVDCVEFDPDLRELDVSDDLSFLVFSLAALGGEPFAELLVRAYGDAGGEPGDDSLIAFYATYRALVRAKIALVRASQHPITSAAHGHENAMARDLIALAERFAWRARLPLVIVVCGVPASGKSYLARAIAETAGLPHLSSDVTRKQLAGLPTTQRAPADSYSAEWNARTYAELGHRTADAVSHAGGAVVDATFRHQADRVSYRSAFAAAAQTLFVECQAPRAELERRAARREGQAGRVSDATPAVVLRELAAWEPLDEVAADAHLILRTDRPLEQILADLLVVLDRRRLRLAPGPR